MWNPALFRLTQRHISRRVFQSLLFVIGIALGVAVGVAIDLANTSARRSFNLSVESVSGRATHQIVGGSSGVSVDVYRQMRVNLGIRTSAPIIESYVQATSLDGTVLYLLGIDPFAEAPFRDYLSDAQNPAALPALYTMITKPNTGLISRTIADRYHIKLGDTITIQTNTVASADIRVIGIIEPEDSVSREALVNILLVDISTAQELAGQPGRLSRIDLILPDNYDLTSIKSILPSGVVVTTPSERRETLQQMTSAFELNLQALSLLALLVGVFLIYNTVTFSVVQRRPVIGILRSLGTTRRQIFVLVLSEALILGFIGTLAGLALGIILGQGAVRLVAQSINDLYFRVNVERVTIESMTLFKGFMIGLLASFFAASIPSFEATRTPPVGVIRRSETESSARKQLPWLTILAMILCLAGWGVLQIHTQSLVVSFAALFLILVGCAIGIPWCLDLTMRNIAPLTARLFGVLGRMAPRAIARSLSRTSVAVAALTVAVSVIVGISVMISSFRSTVAEWLDITLGADIFISPPSQLNADIDPAIADRLQALEGVARVTTVRSVEVQAPDYPNLPPVNLLAPSDNITSRPRRFVWKNTPDYWSSLLDGNIIVSEAFAYRRNITPLHNKLTLLTDQGSQTFTIVGVYYDYTNDQGVVMMHASIYHQYYDDPYVSAIALNLESGVDLNSVLKTLQTKTLVGTGLQAQSNRSLRQSALDVFDRTFSITIALRLLATIVAFVGILSALMSLQFEHTRQYGIMRANGMTPRQLRVFTFLQTGLMGTVAGLLALPIGLILALVLIEVINVRSFGWTMDLILRPQEFIQAFLVALIASLLAGVYPAWRLGKLVAIEALRSE